MMTHECIERFKTDKRDNCYGEGYNRCSGTYPMVLDVWYQDIDGLEEAFDNWKELIVNFCPYCGLKSQPDALYAYETDHPSKHVENWANIKFESSLTKKV